MRISGNSSVKLGLKKSDGAIRIDRLSLMAGDFIDSGKCLAYRRKISIEQLLRSK